MVEILIDPSVREKWSGEALLATFYIEGCTDIQKAQPRISEEISAVMSELRKKGQAILNDSRINRMRATFRAMPDMDPTRYRPASESLIRRCLEKDLFRISPLVDVNNLLSVKLQIPLGIYDLGSVKSTTWEYRIGRRAETYLTISNQVKNADGKLVVADDKGVIGSPVADSGRAAIRHEPDRVIVVAYLPFETTENEANSLVEEIRTTFIRLFSPSTAVHKLLLRLP